MRCSLYKCLVQHSVCLEVSFCNMSWVRMSENTVCVYMCVCVSVWEWSCRTEVAAVHHWTAYQSPLGSNQLSRLIGHCHCARVYSHIVCLFFFVRAWDHSVQHSAILIWRTVSWSSPSFFARTIITKPMQILPADDTIDATKAQLRRPGSATVDHSSSRWLVQCVHLNGFSCASAALRDNAGF